MLLQDKVAIVSGASRGIGRQTALTLAWHGASLVISGTKVDLLNEVAGKVNEMGRKCMVSVGDVTNFETATKVVSQAIKEYGHIDILINNAGMNMRTSTLDMDIEDWKKVMDVNLNGNIYFCKAVLPYMIKQNYGKIVNVSSTTAKSGHKNAIPAYGASKAGIDYLTKHLAIEMAEYNIYVNGVSPGPVETDMIKQWSDEYYQTVVSKIPLKKLGKPQNVADVILFLASFMSDFITGETININGGTYMN
ncbi:SDR family NAD(P)-dependent oxidoreductase [Gracilibacillus sp. S3-1-1]|uniref:SDR family NAD(P)-dependent oxidoreductase n=1 Tax=Gracilibacillus pellucidus TaxID=3095368 RepID=A0ACC6M3R0_9BACI|nr:SDR family NAD(P)-dependent oxidoreductase [Gracilibacillus sp. S3-1-1]MDX8045518.1 SDR family NAD(P)-dependent oxidoreductase [Gracilibacillus sp. S3-1-1]